MNYPIIEIIKWFKDKELSLKLFYFDSTNTIEMQPPDVKFLSKISYYDFNKPERRWVRNKTFLFSIINNLKTCGLWDLVSNKDFITINMYNKKATVDKRAEDLKKITE